jgi:hypothetical protein
MPGFGLGWLHVGFWGQLADVEESAGRVEL